MYKIISFFFSNILSTIALEEDIKNIIKKDYRKEKTNRSFNFYISYNISLITMADFVIYNIFFIAKYILFFIKIY
jgi:hypothetical protein